MFSWGRYPNKYNNNNKTICIMTNKRGPMYKNSSFRVYTMSK